MVVTRAQIISRGARRIGARTGTISSGTATTAVLSGLVNTTGDDSEFQADRLFMLDAANETDKERFINIWEDASGTAHFDTRADDNYTAETYVVSKRQDYTLSEYRDALNVANRETRRTYRYVIPLHQGQTLIPLSGLDFLIGGDDIDKVWVSQSPNLLHNEDIGLWHNGDSAAPDGFTVAGTGALLERQTAGFRSAYGVELTRVSNDATLYQDIPAWITQYLTRSQNAPLTQLSAGAWVTCSTASRARIGIYNGSTTTYGSYHTGTGEPQFLEAEYTPTATITGLRFVLSVDTGDDFATLWWAGLVANEDFPQALRDLGSAGYDEHEVAYHVRNLGGVPAIELREPADGQLVVYTRREFPQMDADTDEVDDQYARALEAGMLSKLLEVRKPNQDRTRLDVILEEERRIWTRLTKNFVSLPVPEPHYRAEIRSA